MMFPKIRTGVKSDFFILNYQIWQIEAGANSAQNLKQKLYWKR
jgi:hypothetical protein